MRATGASGPSVAIAGAHVLRFAAPLAFTARDQSCLSPVKRTAGPPDSVATTDHRPLTRTETTTRSMFQLSPPSPPPNVVWTPTDLRSWGKIATSCRMTFVESLPQPESAFRTNWSFVPPASMTPKAVRASRRSSPPVRISNFT